MRKSVITQLSAQWWLLQGL